MNEVSSETTASSTGSASLAMLRPLLESVDSLDGVWEREGTVDEHRDDPAELRFSRGISSLLMRGLESRDFGVPECERCLEPSRDFGVFTGAEDGFEELRRRDGSLVGKKSSLVDYRSFQRPFRLTCCSFGFS
jgi:hypothetical protein